VVAVPLLGTSGTFQEVCEVDTSFCVVGAITGKLQDVAALCLQSGDLAGSAGPLDAGFSRSN